MARALTPTLLSLDRWCSIIGNNPVHFNGGRGSIYYPDIGDCQDIWPQFSWQGPTVIAREDLALAIRDAEEDIRHILGFPLAPTFIPAENVPYPHFYDRTISAPTRNIRGKRKRLYTKQSHVLSLGRRALTLIDANVGVDFDDVDGDGFNETARVTVTTPLTNPKEIKVYFTGHNGDSAWEIRPVTSITIGSGQAVIRFPVWLIFLKEAVDQAPSTDGFQPIDIENDTNYELLVDVYREYVDTTNPVTFNFIDEGCGDGTETPSTGTGSATLVDGHSGAIVPYPNQAYMTEPESVTLWYQAGDVNEKYLDGSSLDPLSDYWAQTITWLATARLKLPICACSPIQDLVNDLQRNVLQVDRSRNTIFSIITPEMITNPFGTRVGEIRAWDRVSRVAGAFDLGGGAF